MSNQSREAALMVGRGTDSKGVNNLMNMTALGRGNCLGDNKRGISDGEWD